MTETTIQRPRISDARTEPASAARSRNSAQGGRQAVHPRNRGASASTGRPVLRAVGDVAAPARPVPRARPVSRPAPLSRPGQPSRPAAPGRPGRPSRQGPARPAGLPQQDSLAQPARSETTVRTAVPRVRFVLLILGLLAGSLICLLVINTTLGAASFRLTQLQHRSASLATQEENLRQKVAAGQAPAAIARRAYALGMRTENNTKILDLRSGQIFVVPGHVGVGVDLGAPQNAASSAQSASHSAATPSASTTPKAARSGP